MITTLLAHSLNRFGGAFGYDVSYLRHLLRVDRTGFVKFGLATRLSFHRAGVPKAAWYAAKITTARAEDCGPCTQLVVDMALKSGVPAEAIAAMLVGDETGMGADATVGWRLARGVAEHAPDMVEQAIAEATLRWGAKGHASLALVIAGSRLYPTLKTALGFGRTCHQIKVAGTIIKPLRSTA